MTPEPIPRLCTPRLITMRWVEGEPFAATASWSEADALAAARILLRVFLRGVFAWGEVHADPHPGNLRFARTPAGVQVGVLDFGCVRPVTAAEAAAFHRLATEGDTLDAAALLDVYTSAGFDRALLTPIASRLPDVTRVLFEPFLARGPYDAGQWQVSERLADVLGEDRWNFRAAGPASLIFFIRALVGVVQYVSRLGVGLDWHAELVAASAGQLAPPAPVASTAVSTSPERTNSMHADVLKLSVVKDGQQVVRLTFGASAVEHWPRWCPRTCTTASPHAESTSGRSRAAPWRTAIPSGSSSRSTKGRRPCGCGWSREGSGRRRGRECTAPGAHCAGRETRREAGVGSRKSHVGSRQPRAMGSGVWLRRDPSLQALEPSSPAATPHAPSPTPRSQVPPP
ncbi:MAG: AarF/UbiB family protein [Vicinamibacterales bacterium]